MTSRKLLSLIVCLSTACILPPDPEPLIDFRLDALTQYNHRGMVQDANPVVQGELAVNLATKGEGELEVRAWGNVATDSDNGDAWQPEGHGGEITESQYVAQYTQSWQGTDITVGFFHYNIANGAEFVTSPAMGRRGPTSEVFARVGGDIGGGIIPSVTGHYDVDEVESFYAEANIRKDFPMGDSFSLGLDANIAYSAEDASLWAYGFGEAGWSDWRARAVLTYIINEQVQIRGTVGYSNIIDEQLRSWFDQIGISEEQLWGGIGITFSF